MIRSFLTSLTVLTVLAMLPCSAQAQAVNDTCPLSGQAVSKSSPTRTYKGTEVAFCCNKCTASFDKMNDETKAALVAKVDTKPTTPAGKKSAKLDPAEEISLNSAYLLTTCPVSTRPLGSNVVFAMVDGRQVGFCCGGCKTRFNRDKDAYNKKIDEQIVKNQMHYYPMDTCIVSGRKLGDNAVNHVAGNQLVRLCCKGCVDGFNDNKDKYLLQIDEMVVKTQSKDYPLKTCPVSDEALGSNAVDVVVGDRLVRLCCTVCKKSFDKDPARYMPTVDKAWKAQCEAEAASKKTASR